MSLLLTKKSIALYSYKNHTTAFTVVIKLFLFKLEIIDYPVNFNDTILSERCIVYVSYLICTVSVKYCFFALHQQKYSTDY